MRRSLRWLGWIALVLVAVPVVAVVVIVVMANLQFGRQLIEDQTASLTGGMVRIQGISGEFPDALRIGMIQVSDSDGPYVTITDAALDWSPTRLLKGVVQVDRLTAASVDFSRLPVSKGGSTSSGGSFQLPLPVDVQALRIDKAAIGAAVAGTAATLAVSGSGLVRQLTEGTVHLAVNRLDSPGQYNVDGDVSAQTIAAVLKVQEPAKGLISQVASLPDLGAIALTASVQGPKDALATQLSLTAGQLSVSAGGTVDLTYQAADLTVHAQAPAMEPAPGISWQSVLVDTKVSGPFSRPDAKGTVRIEGLTGGGARVGGLDADIAGNAGLVTLHATITDLHVPGPKPDILSAAPAVLDISVRLDAADRPVTFALKHPLVSVDGSAETALRQTVSAQISLPDLAALAAAGGVDLRGRAALDLQAGRDGDTTSAGLQGTVAITGGMSPLPALVGDHGQIDMAASMRGSDITLSRLSVNGKALSVSVDGGLTASDVDLNWTVALSDLAAVAPDLSGKADAKGHAGGAMDALAVQAEIGADVAGKGFKSGHLNAHIDATGLPAAPNASVTADGTLLGAPLNLALTADRIDGVAHANISKLSWKSLQGQGAFSLTPPATLPVGHLKLSFARLADLEPLIGQKIAGSAEANLDADDKVAKLLVSLREASVPGTAAMSKLVLSANVTDPAGDPAIDGTLTADGVSVGNAKGVSARVAAKGKLTSLAVTVSAEAPDVNGGPAKLATAGTVDAKSKTLALARMEANWKEQTLRLLAPAKLSFANGVAIDRLRLGFRQAELTISGRAGSKLDLVAVLRNLPADVGAIVDPSLSADGVIAAEVRLTGTSARPEGTIKLTADRVRLRNGPGRALPTANLVANVALKGVSAGVDIRLVAGPSHVTVTGSAPLSASGGLDLKTDGLIDLAMLNPLLSVQGQRARGEVALNATVTGTTAAPRVNGTAELSNGDLADYPQGLHVTGLAAVIQASGDTIRLASFTGKAGPGTLGGSGTIGLAGQIPIDLHFTADDARPVASDLITATLDADVTVQGEAKGNLLVGGTLHVRRADIRIPDKMPANVAVLPVRIAGAPPPPREPAAPPSTIALNVTLNAPQQVFIRGRGLDAEVGGTIHIKGTARDPVPDGGLQLRRGTLSLVGTTLTFTEGTISFNGAGLTDPALHFVASSTTSTITATLTVSGTAKDPKITLSSVPDLPQDEILAQLLFDTSSSKLSPLQLAQIAAALAQLSGATGSFDPLDSLRTGLGLDRLSVGANAAGDPTVQAGRYVARGVYVGATQGTSGGAPQATVQVDLAKGLKLETTAGSSSSSATGSSSSTDAASVGLTYQFEY